MACLVPDESKVEGGVRHNVEEARLVNQAVRNLLLWPGQCGQITSLVFGQNSYFSSWNVPKIRSQIDRKPP